MSCLANCAAAAQACIDVVPKNPANFNVDNVRVVKILGAGAHDSKVVKGVVIKRSTEGAIQDVSDAKVAVFAQGVDTAATETKVPLTPAPVHPLMPDRAIIDGTLPQNADVLQSVGL